jgi:glutathione S-transferase
MANSFLVDYPLLRMTTLKLMNLVGDSKASLFPQGIRAKLALSHMGVLYEEASLKVEDLIPDGLWGPEEFPFLLDGDRTIKGSWELALYLERNFPEAPTLFGGMAGIGAAKCLDLWFLNTLDPLFINLGKDYLKSHFEVPKDYQQFLKHCSLFQKDLDIADWSELELRPLQKILTHQSFIGGESPAYSDYLFASNLIWLDEIGAQSELPIGPDIEKWLQGCTRFYRKSPPTPEYNYEKF